MISVLSTCCHVIKTMEVHNTCLGYTQRGERCKKIVNDQDYCPHHLYQKDCEELQNVEDLNRYQIGDLVKAAQVKPRKLSRVIKRVTPAGTNIKVPLRKLPPPVKRVLPVVNATPITTHPEEIADIFKLLTPERRTEDIFKEFAIDYRGKEEEETNNGYLFEYQQIEEQRRDIEKQKEELFTYEDRLVRWEASLKKKEASLKEKEVVLNLLLAEDPAPIEQKFEEMSKAIDVFAAMMKRLRGYREDNLVECCVCYNQHLTKDELLSCGHPVCPDCKIKLPKPECPLCRKPIVTVPRMEEAD